VFDTYKPSGRFSLSFVLWFLIAGLLTIVAAFVYQLGLHWIPIIYANLLLTLAMGYVVGTLNGIVIQQGKVRNTGIALLCLLGLIVIGLGAKFTFQYLRARGELRQFLSQIDQELRMEDGQVVSADEVVQAYTPVEHLKERVEVGWQIGKVGQANQGNPMSGIVVYIVWLIELGAIGYIAGKATLAAMKRPFSEKMGVWADESEVVMILPVTNEEMVAKIKAAISVQDLLELPIPKSDESNQFAVYTVHSVPGVEMEDAYLTVELQTHLVNGKGEKEVKTQSLVRNAILSSAQRGQLKENAEIMNEAFAAYRASLQNPSADSDQPPI
jgi:hypothetical protein